MLFGLFKRCVVMVISLLLGTLVFVVWLRVLCYGLALTCGNADVDFVLCMFAVVCRVLLAALRLACRWCLFDGSLYLC